eukprot:TRINITY_DN14307_c0_g2_i1.p1 TRINITY_DN14307_c0_g2~~TRINITY_DN14307_c0_g2_i1.p1  ORF type:complete len:348 (+),score=31.57 TRINITY_DN14307_c0_g2_i1:31-1074(+)
MLTSDFMYRSSFPSLLCIAFGLVLTIHETAARSQVLRKEQLESRTWKDALALDSHSDALADAYTTTKHNWTFCHTDGESPCQLHFPGLSLDMLDCFSRVAESEGIDYFLFFGSNLAVARGGEAIPWDLDIDLAHDSAMTEKLLRAWADPGKHRVYNTKFPECARSIGLASIACPEEGTAPREKKFKFYRINNKTDEKFAQRTNRTGCRVQRIKSTGVAYSLDVWNIPTPSLDDPTKVCHWGFCVDKADVLPLKSCKLTSTPLHRAVQTRCMQRPESFARFYSQRVSKKFYGTDRWQRPSHNVWNATAGHWEWCEEAWNLHKDGKRDLYSYSMPAECKTSLSFMPPSH